ncbi:GNAT family N-acetyltransferase [Photobacterium leiognathi]|uniref:GNAT family N-acetyltransferase n=1 Tax=Photobacterium leiognathi TaxID=553611 RepID=UPI0029814EF9|nr:GNAT family N-acetyltransferase [Photobacterium leiognathi]
MTQLTNIMCKEEHDGFLYVYFENYENDCNCMWRKNPEYENVYSIERVDILPQFRRSGCARKLLENTLKRISEECPQACVEITAKPDENSGLTVENLVAFYESLGFETYLRLGDRVHLRLYFDCAVKPSVVYDHPFFFK